MQLQMLGMKKFSFACICVCTCTCIFNVWTGWNANASSLHLYLGRSCEPGFRKTCTVNPGLALTELWTTGPRRTVYITMQNVMPGQPNPQALPNSITRNRNAWRIGWCLVIFQSRHFHCFKEATRNIIWKFHMFLRFPASKLNDCYRRRCCTLYFFVQPCFAVALQDKFSRPTLLSSPRGVAE